MRFVTYSWKGRVALDAMLDGQVVDLHRTYIAAVRHSRDSDELAVADLRVPGDLLGLLRGGEASMTAAWNALKFVEEHWTESKAGGLYLPIEDVQLLAPILNPGKVVCVGLNYRSHLREIGETASEYPVLFHKVATSLIGHEQSIVIPRISRQVDYEGELALVDWPSRQNHLRAGCSRIRRRLYVCQ